MLVVTRDLNESIWIGDDIRIKICQLKGEKVCVGVEAPKTMKICKLEACDAESDSAQIKYT